MKIVLATLLSLEIAFGLLLVLPEPEPPERVVRAIAAYYREPTPERKSEIERQRRIIRDRRFRESVLIASLLASNSLGLFFVIRRIRIQNRAVV